MVGSLFFFFLSETKSKRLPTADSGGESFPFLFLSDCQSEKVRVRSRVRVIDRVRVISRVGVRVRVRVIAGVRVRARIRVRVRG